MFRNFRVISLILCILASSLFLKTNSSTAKSYSINVIKISAEIQPDGSLLIEEHRTYTYRGIFHWAEYKVPLEKLGQITNFSITENQTTYQQQQGARPGTYELYQNSEEFYVKWYYNAKNERRTFTLRYRITDAVTVYRDVAELNFKFVGAYANKSIGSVDVWVKLPQVADTAFVRAWAHGPLHGQLAFEQEQIHLWVQPLPRKRHWIARIIFPTDWVPAAQKFLDTEARNNIMAEEKKLVEESNERRDALEKKEAFKSEHKKDAAIFCIFISAVGLILLFMLYKRYGTAFQVRSRARYSSDIPENLSPALANYVHFTGQMGAGAMVATLFDLARQDYVKIEENRSEKKSMFGTRIKTSYSIKFMKEHFEANKKSLKPHERDLIDFMFFQLGHGNDEINFETIKKSGRKFLELFNKWKKIIKQEWGNKPFYDKQSVKGTVFSALFSVFLIIVGIAIIVFVGEPGIIAIVSGSILFGLSFIILRYTKEVKELKSQLSALNLYLKQYHFKRESGSLTTKIETYFIYGIALGAGNKVIKELLMTVPEWQHSTYFPWYIGAISHNSPASFANSVSSMVTSVSSTMGSAAGVGGGASAGGAGAAGGATGGAG